MRAAALPAPLDQRFEAIVFDWDGTAVPDRAADATELRELVEELCACGAYVAVVSGTHVDNVDGQLRARPLGPGRLVLGLNRGSEIFTVDATGPQLVSRRVATPDEDAALTRAAELTVARLAAAGLHAELVAPRLNRRKIDLIPEPEWADPPKAQIELLLGTVVARLAAAGLSGLREVVDLALGAAREAGLADPRVTSDAKHVEIGLTDKSDSAQWIFADLWKRGIGPGVALVGGDEFGPLGGLPGSDSLMLVPGAARAVAVSVGVEPGGFPDRVVALGGGPPAFIDLLDDQLRRRRERRVPFVDADPAWTVTVDGLDPQQERACEAMLAIADGRACARGSPLVVHPAAEPLALVAGVYDGKGPDTQLLAGPIWHRVTGPEWDGRGLRRVLDLRAGLLAEVLALGDGLVRSLRFSSLARPGTVTVRAESHAPLMAPGEPPLAAPPGIARTGTAPDGAYWMQVVSSSGGITAAALDEQSTKDRQATLERIGAVVGDPSGVPPAEAALALLREAQTDGFERLLAEHRTHWASRWENADAAIEGDDELALAVRFGLFHLMANVADTGEAAVGARGLTGPAYRGHVFWDTDVFVLPFLAATHPPAARAVLEYRVRRLSAARETARALGRAGARFPWESARSGRDVTPTSARDRAGALVPIRTGQLEDHIVADVAWAAACYVDWTGDEEFAAGPGRELLLDTARYWASRLHEDADGSAHIFGVIGPDEYHEPVDDNAYTNVMARWNLRRAAVLPGVDANERDRWLHLADALVDGYDPDTGIYEQFAGFHRLEPLVIEEVAPRRPIAADLLLGRKRVKDAQVVKQADVLMLHHLVPDEVASDSLGANLRFYEPRTAHGSSLSPGVHAALFARARDFDRALALLRITARIDLDDVTRTTAGGLHLATFGSVWQALAFGFMGLRPRADALELDPVLPPAWSALDLRVRFRGARIRLRKEPGRLQAWADPGTTLRLGGDALAVGTDGRAFRRRESRWEAET